MRALANRKLCGTALAKKLPNLEHLAIAGNLDHIPVTQLADSVKLFPKLKRLDITDEQAMEDDHDTMIGMHIHSITGLTVDMEEQRDEFVERLMDAAVLNHPLNEVRSRAAKVFFSECPKLDNISFVRLGEGCMYRPCVGVTAP